MRKHGYNKHNMVINTSLKALVAILLVASVASAGTQGESLQRSQHGRSADSCSCSFANGMWTPSNETGRRWTTVPAPGACRVANLITQRAAISAPEPVRSVRDTPAAAPPGAPPTPQPPAQRPLDVFAFGSSVDALFLENFCDWVQARHPGAKANRTVWEQIHLRRAGLARCDGAGAGLRVFHAWHFGVHLDGPYHEDRAGNPHLHMRAASEALGRQPNVVLLGTGLWDSARVVYKEHGARMTHPALLPVDWIDGFAANATVGRRPGQGEEGVQGHVGPASSHRLWTRKPQQLLQSAGLACSRP